MEAVGKLWRASNQVHHRFILGIGDQRKVYTRKLVESSQSRLNAALWSDRTGIHHKWNAWCNADIATQIANRRFLTIHERVICNNRWAGSYLQLIHQEIIHWFTHRKHRRGALRVFTLNLCIKSGHRLCQMSNTGHILVCVVDQRCLLATFI